MRLQLPTPSEGHGGVGPRGEVRPGHATISITLDLYGHVIPMTQERTATAMEEALA